MDRDVERVRAEPAPHTFPLKERILSSRRPDRAVSTVSGGISAGLVPWKQARALTSNVFIKGRCSSLVIDRPPVGICKLA